MNSIPTPQEGDSDKEQTSSEGIQKSKHQSELNITDGGEFLDDAIRMKDQPLMEIDLKIFKPKN